MFVAVVIILVSLILVMHFVLPRKVDIQQDLKEAPFVSILIACRNEEYSITRCLTAISHLNYPKDKLQVLIGNDSSEDKTEQVVSDFVKDVAYMTLVNIEEFESKTKGKARVLSCLSQEASGEYLFVTDADIAVNKDWIQGLLYQFTEQIALVSGVTLCEKKGMFSYIQAMDWLYAQTMVQAVEYFGKQVTAMGNNMAIKKAVYDEIGGYENIPFSATEDFDLFCAVKEKGYQTSTIVCPETLAYTLPLEKVKTLFHQRKRWTRGAMNVPKLLVVILLFHAVFFPALVMVLLEHWKIGIALLTVKILLQFNLLHTMHYQVNIKTSKRIGFKYICWEIFNWIFPVLLLVYYALPTKVDWKGRRY